MKNQKSNSFIIKDWIQEQIEAWKVRHAQTLERRKLLISLKADKKMWLMIRREIGVVDIKEDRQIERDSITRLVRFMKNVDKNLNKTLDDLGFEKNKKKEVKLL